MRLDQMVLWQVEHHGGLRKAARALRIDAAYLSRLASGEKENPSKRTLSKLGIVRKVTINYEWEQVEVR